MRNKAVVLLSGGLDSATVLYLARSHGYKCLCIIFDYGQRHKREIESAKRIAKSALCPYEILKIKFPWKGSALLDNKVKIPGVTKSQSQCGAKRSLPGGDKVTSAIPATYVPARNIIFLSFAVSYAEAVGAETVFIGAHAEDYSGYPDCRPEFFRAFRKTVSCGTKAGIEGRGIDIKAPIINKGKSEIVKLGKRLKVPFELTWSCYRGERHPCGKCDSCRFRAKGFKGAGIKDPLN
ncbi:MAG: 7-cyano-7-deazaguanine synthase QueC [Candidatus Omnitrophota bacterium]